MDSPDSAARHRGPDRRRRSTPIFSRWSLLGGRRRGGRRADEQQDVFVDLYSLPLVSLLVFFFFLTVVDSVATLVYLGKGGRELNPVAQWMIDQGAICFVMTKGVLSGLCLMFVLLHKNFKAARFAIGLGLAFYFVLGVYHLVLQIRAS